MSAATQLRKDAEAIAEAAMVLTDPLARLRRPFPAEHVGKLPKGGVLLDYVGHGAVTDRLLEVDPEWTWEPMALDQGLPRFTYDASGNPIALWIRLTVCGVTRLGCGTCRAGQFDAEKVLIGDAIRNAAMRFGVALDLWIRGHAEDDEKRSEEDDRTGPARKAEFVWDEKAVQFELRNLFDGDKDEARKAWEYSAPDVTTQWSKDTAKTIHDAWLGRPIEGEPVALPLDDDGKFPTKATS